MTDANALKTTSSILKIAADWPKIFSITSLQEINGHPADTSAKLACLLSHCFGIFSSRHFSQCAWSSFFLEPRKKLAQSHGIFDLEDTRATQALFVILAITVQSTDQKLLLFLPSKTWNNLWKCYNKTERLHAHCDSETTASELHAEGKKLNSKLASTDSKFWCISAFSGDFLSTHFFASTWQTALWVFL